jgi:hypothetical protein
MAVDDSLAGSGRARLPPDRIVLSGEVIDRAVLLRVSGLAALRKIVGLSP